MATYGWPDVQPLLVGGYDLVGDGTVTMELTIPGFTRVSEEATGAGSTWEQHKLTGEKKAKGPASLKVFYDDTAATGTKAALTTQSSNRVFILGYEGGAIGAGFAGGLGHAVDVDTPPSKGQLTKLVATLLLTGTYDPFGKILKNVAAVTADGNSQASSVDNAASSANGGAAYFAVKSLTLGTATDIILKVMHSTDNVSFAALATATAVTAAPAAEQVVVAAATTVNRYLAGLWDYSGTPNGATTATIFIGFARR